MLSMVHILSLHNCSSRATGLRGVGLAYHHCEWSIGPVDWAAPNVWSSPAVEDSRP